MDEIIPLRYLHEGQVAEIAQICGDPCCTQRLHEMGLASGTRVEVVRQGNPCIIRFSGTKLCFRENESTSVMVRVPAAVAV
jgi:Fe2+ transport system protein FeoA